MKKLLFSFALVAISLTIFSFSSLKTDEKYPDDVPSEYIEAFKSDFIKTIHSEALKVTLESNFCSLFDKVYAVDAQMNPEAGFYYLVFGEKNGVNKIELLKTSQSDIDNEAYTYIDFTNIEVNATTEYCRAGNGYPFPPVCQGGCLPRDNNCLGILCGIRVGNQCIIQ
ncbi:MAG: hypothetical protein KTR22_14925 [Flavobacteriaceae bacterium]|nr:hypothetical protein [Flavobacteriaceae bacterium]